MIDFVKKPLTRFKKISCDILKGKSYRISLKCKFLMKKMYSSKISVPATPSKSLAVAGRIFEGLMGGTDLYKDWMKA